MVILTLSHIIRAFLRLLKRATPDLVRLVRGGSNMYAIIATGGKQYKVEKDLIINVEKLEANVGDKINLDVLMISDDKGVKLADDLKKAKVEAEVVEHGKGKKINIFKYKAKKNIRKRQGHRQPYTAIKITAIKA